MDGTERIPTAAAPATRHVEFPRDPAAPPAPGPLPAAAQATPGQVAVRHDPRGKSVPLACVLSAMPGLGQVYVGYYQRGFVHSLIVASLITALASNRLDVLTPLFGLFLPFFWLYNVVDAGRRASLYNQALVGSESIELPQDFQAPGRGSIWGGLVLIAVGSILLSNTRFGYSLEWVEEWWPAAPILFGLFLLGRAVQDRLSDRA